MILRALFCWPPMGRCSRSLSMTMRWCSDAPVVGQVCPIWLPEIGVIAGEMNAEIVPRMRLPALPKGTDRDVPGR